MLVDEIVTRVRKAIDEVTQNDSEFLNQSSDERNLNSIIIDKIPYALTYVLENAPEDKFLPEDLSGLTEEEGSGITIEAGKVVKVEIPADVLRIVSARLSSWLQSPVPVTEFSQAYLMQQDEYARGSWDRPVNAIVYHGKVRYLEMYCAKGNSDEVELAFVRKPNLPIEPGSDALGVVAAGDGENATEVHGEPAGTMEEQEVNVPSRLVAAFIYQIAGLTMVAFREEVSKSLFALASKYLGVDVKGE